MTHSTALPYSAANRCLRRGPRLTYALRHYPLAVEVDRTTSTQNPSVDTNPKYMKITLDCRTVSTTTVLKRLIEIAYNQNRACVSLALVSARSVVKKQGAMKKKSQGRKPIRAR